jgi:hypothetical protein
MKLKRDETVAVTDPTTKKKHRFHHKQIKKKMEVTFEQEDDGFDD